MEVEATTPEAWPEIINALSDEPAEGSRAGGMRERLCVTVRSNDPRERWLLRDDSFNMAFALQESFAYWEGLNPGHVDRYVDMSEWMVDGELPGSAYGDRMRNTIGHDQLERVERQLRDKPSTRRAVVHVHQPAIEDYDGPDVSCTDSIQFIARDGELHMRATVRSQDMYWGYAYDTQNNQYILEAMAGRLGLDVGEYVHEMTSCHYYTDFEEDALDAIGSHASMAAGDMRLDADEHDEAMQILGMGLDTARGGSIPDLAIDELDRLSRRYGDWLRTMTVYEMRRFHDEPAAADETAAGVSTPPFARWLSGR